MFQIAAVLKLKSNMELISHWTDHSEFAMKGAYLCTMMLSNIVSISTLFEYDNGKAIIDIDI